MVLRSKPFLALELAVLMLGMPLLMWWAFPAKALLPVLWLMTLLCYFIARAADPARITGGWNWRAVTWPNLKPILLRFIFCTVLLLAATAIYRPDLLFNFVLNRTPLWAMVMVLYPILSVIPQEILFRRYIFARYRALISSAAIMVLVSGIGFGFAHIVLNNWVAPLLSTVGGILFSLTYHKTRSLALAVIEHALYGNAVFTIGLGYYFYHGAVH